jgi:hypothetical protein
MLLLSEKKMDPRKRHNISEKEGYKMVCPAKSSAGNWSSKR